MESNDWIPPKDAEFNEFFTKYCRYVDAKCTGAHPEWTHIPEARRTELNTACAAWVSAWNKLDQAHTSADVLAKNEAKEGGKRILRDFNKQYVLYARELNDAERRDLGATIHDATPTIVHAPHNQPEADVIYPGKRLLELTHIRPVVGGADEKRSDWGVRIFWGIMGEPVEGDRFRIAAPPLTGKDLPHSTFTHRSKYRFDFEGDSGRTVWFCLRYENNKGGKDGEGPFGPLFNAIIP
jgi:hypothetical protein